MRTLNSYVVSALCGVPFSSPIVNLVLTLPGFAVGAQRHELDDAGRAPESCKAFYSQLYKSVVRCDTLVTVLVPPS